MKSFVEEKMRDRTAVTFRSIPEGEDLRKAGIIVELLRDFITQGERGRSRDSGNPRTELSSFARVLEQNRLQKLHEGRN
jgi:hypothetical protein